MPSLFDLCTNPESKKKLDELNQLLKAEREEKLQAEAEERERRHRERHIFDSYEQALDWLVEHQGSTIEWHTKTLHWDEGCQKFISREQEYSYDGVIPYDVVRQYTREQLLEGIEEHKKWMKNKYEDFDSDDYKDKYGKLDYVYVRHFGINNISLK